MGITLRHEDRLVSQDFFQRVQVSPAHHEVRSEGMTQIVEAEIGNPTFADSRIEGFPNILDAPSVRPCENKLRTSSAFLRLLYRPPKGG